MRKLKYILIFLIIALAAINTILYFGAVELEEAVVSPAPIQMEEVLSEETIVTGVCTFGDCPVATAAPETTEAETSQDLAETSQARAAEEYSSTPSQVTANSQLLTEPETEESTDLEVFSNSELLTTQKPEPEEAPDGSGRTVRCYVTAYCGCESCSGEFGPYTCFGTPCRANHTVAVDPDFIPYWTQLEINGIVYTAEDCGSAVNGWEIDIYFPEHWQTEAWKTGWYDVTIY